MNIPQSIHESWHPLIGGFFESDSWKNLRDNVLKYKFYPEKQNVFRVFQMPVDKIKVVILGQDPYAKKGQATGLAFAVNDGFPKPFSLQAIEKENGSGFERSLIDLEGNGVFLLNTALTVQPDVPGSHLKHWRKFTEQVISRLSKVHPAFYMIWGEKAKSFLPFIDDYVIQDYNNCIHAYVDLHRNNVLISGHPAAEYYSSGKGGFYGKYHMRLVDDILKNRKLRTIFK